ELAGQIGVESKPPFPRLSYAEAMRRYGTDKPDTRYEMELIDLGELLAGTEVAPYRTALESGGEVKAVNAAGSAQYSRKALDELGETAKRFGAGGLAWAKVSDAGEITSSLAKGLGLEKLEQMTRAAGCQPGDLLLVAAGKPSAVAAALNTIRTTVAERE